MKKRYSKKNRINRQFALLAFVLFAGILTTSLCLIRTRAAAAEKKSDADAYYTSVRLSCGDTLWTLAETYSPDKSASGISSYVKEIRQLNNIKDSTCLKAGNYIVVKYYR